MQIKPGDRWKKTAFPLIMLVMTACSNAEQPPQRAPAPIIAIASPSIEINEKTTMALRIEQDRETAVARTTLVAKPTHSIPTAAPTTLVPIATVLAGRGTIYANGQYQDSRYAISNTWRLDINSRQIWAYAGEKIADPYVGAPGDAVVIVELRETLPNGHYRFISTDTYVYPSLKGPLKLVDAIASGDELKVVLETPAGKRVLFNIAAETWE